MKQYYYSDGQQQIGPISKDELKLKGITKETLVWCEGLSNWTKAGEIEDLADLFPNIPTSQINATSSNSEDHTVFNTNALLSSIICGGLILFYGILQVNFSIEFEFPFWVDPVTFPILFCICVGIGFLIGTFKRIQEDKIWFKLNKRDLILISIGFFAIFFIFASSLLPDIMSIFNNL